jgi:hypothetical protein
MVRFATRHIIILLLLFQATIGIAQNNVLSEVNINRKSVYVGQPVEVSVGIFTPTWFTKGVNFGNIKVNGAFTVYFRSVSTSKKINGKNYAGVVAIYNVFPYDDDDLVFPSLEMVVETPDEGGFKGVKRSVKTKSRDIVVKAVPNGNNTNDWLVANNVSVNESWQGDLNTVKVGDVVKRTVYRKVYGTVSELIPPVFWDSVQGVSIYPSRSSINTEKTKTTISATRTEGARYLFEKEGTVTLPEITVTWWNPNQNKLLKRTLKEKTLEVLPNPDLGMLETVKDSLKIDNPEISEASSEDEAMKIFGLSLKEFLMDLIAFLICSYFIYKFLKWLLISKGLLAKWKQQRLEALSSEQHYFKIFLKQVSNKNKKEVVNALYLWIDRLQLKEPTLTYFALKYGSDLFISSIRQTSLDKPFDPLLHVEDIKMARKKYLKTINRISITKTGDWINP